MSDQATITTIILGALTFFLPPIVSFLRGCNAPPWVVGVIFFAICFVAAGISLYLQEQILNPPALNTRADYLQYYLFNLMAVITLARVWYSTFWKTIGAGATAGLESTGPQLGGDTPK